MVTIYVCNLETMGVMCKGVAAKIAVSMLAEEPSIRYFERVDV